MLNKVMIIGRLGQTPELRYTKGSGVPMTTLNVATDESYVDRDGNKQKSTEWHRVVVFQRQAENCCNYLAKGSLVYVEGSLTTRKWQDQNGQDRYTTEIRARTVQFLDRKGDRPQEGEGAQDWGSYQRNQWSGDRGAPPAQSGGDESGASRRLNSRPPQEDMGPAFPSEATYPSEGSDLDSVPF